MDRGRGGENQSNNLVFEEDLATVSPIVANDQNQVSFLIMVQMQHLVHNRDNDTLPTYQEEAP